MLGDYVTKGACSKSVGKLADMVTFPTNIIDHPGWKIANVCLFHLQVIWENTVYVTYCFIYLMVKNFQEGFLLISSKLHKSLILHMSLHT